jgi:hypothetical protein
MQISKFTLNRVAHIIQARGDLFLFSGYERDSNNELDTSKPRRNSVKGLFHETNSHITLLGADIGSVQTKPNPGILATLAEASKLKIDDVVTVNTAEHKVTGIKDIINAGVIAEISLEVIV